MTPVFTRFSPQVIDAGTVVFPLLSIKIFFPACLNFLLWEMCGADLMR